MKIKHPRTRGIIIAGLVLLSAFTGITFTAGEQALIADKAAEYINE